MKQNPIPDASGFTKRSDWLATFVATPKFYELSGPGTLVRLVQFEKSTYDGLQLEDSRPDGAFWFAEELLVRVRNEARLELARQAAKTTLQDTDERSRWQLHAACFPD